jgi:four helix bundle protein
LKRSAVSIPSNIAEGKGRGRTGHFVNHLIIALGSEAELQTQLELSVRLGFITAARTQPLLDAASEIGRMLNGLIASLEASKG